MPDKQLPKRQGRYESDQEKGRWQEDPIYDFPGHFVLNYCLLIGPSSQDNWNLDTLGNRKHELPLNFTRVLVYHLCQSVRFAKEDL